MTILQDSDVQCECVHEDCLHPAEQGSGQCIRQAAHILYRCDLDDHTGTAFCEECAEDAIDCGLFYDYGDESAREESRGGCDGNSD